MADLNRYLSASRLGSYSQAIPATPTTTVFGTFDLYVYNMTLAGSFLGPIHILEVVTRNAMLGHLSNFAGQDDWWDSPKIFLMGKHKQKIIDTKRRLLDGHANRAAW